jgi:hypothetical protein
MNVNFFDAFFGLGNSSDNRILDDMKRIFPFVNQIWGVKEAVWIDTNDWWKLYLEIPELRMVIDRRASMMASNVPLLVDADGNEVTNHWFSEVLKKPNPVQSWSDLVYSLSVQDALYSNSFIYAPKRSFDIRNLFVPLPSNKIQINLSGKKLKQMEQEGLIDSFVFQYDDKNTETIDFTDLIYLMTNDGMNIVKPVSRMESLKYPLSNIKASYHKRNVLLENIGAIGILSTQNNDMGGAIPMTPEEKKQIQKDWFRRQKDELIITESQVDWKPMSFPTKDLMLFEELSADKIAIIDTFGMSLNIFSTEKGATFTNVRDSIRMTYQDTIIPETQQMYDSIGQQCGLTDEGLKLIAEFDHLPVMQDDEVAIATTMKLKAETLEKLNGLGIDMSSDEMKALLGL